MTVRAPRRVRFALIALAAVTLAMGAVAARARAELLVPMDERQTDHLKAYGLAYWVLTRGQKAEWLRPSRKARGWQMSWKA